MSALSGSGMAGSAFAFVERIEGFALVDIRFYF
jgi:hypothetical protein